MSFGGASLYWMSWYHYENDFGTDFLLRLGKVTPLDKPSDLQKIEVELHTHYHFINYFKT
jgi:hypothetical protein